MHISQSIALRNAHGKDENRKFKYYLVKFGKLKIF